MEIREFFSFLKDKIVLKDLAKFLGGAISIAVIVDAFEDNLSLPPWWFNVFIFLSIASIIPYLIFRVHDRKMELLSGQKYQYSFNWKDPLSKFIVFYSTLCLVLLVFLINNWNKTFLLGNHNITKGLVLVDEFVNLTGDEELDKIGGRAKKSIIYYLQHNDIKVIPPQEENMVKEIFGEELDIASLSLIPDLHIIMGHEFTIRGDYSYVGSDSIEVSCEIINSNNQSIKEFIPVIVKDSNFKKSLSQLAQTITGYWTIRGKDLDLLDPLIWDSREDWMNALNSWPDYDKALPFIISSMKNDTQFFAPKYLYCSYLRNTGAYTSLDSMLWVLEEKRSEMGSSDLNLLDFYKAEIQGDLTKANQLFLNEFKKDEKNWFYNTSMANYYLQNVNDPLSAIQTLEKINFEYERSPYHRDRLRAKTDAFLRLKRTEEALEVIAQYERFDVDQSLCALKARALVQLDDIDQLNRFREEYKAMAINWRGAEINELDILYFILKEAFVQKKGNIKRYFDSVFIEQFDTIKLTSFNSPIVTGIYYFTDKTDKLKILDPETLSPFLRIKLGMDTISTEKLLAKLSDIPAYNFGDKKYEIAKLILAHGTEEKAIQLLREAYSDGHKFYRWRYNYDPELLDLYDNPKFKEFTNPKK